MIIRNISRCSQGALYDLKVKHYHALVNLYQVYHTLQLFEVSNYHVM